MQRRRYLRFWKHIVFLQIFLEEERIRKLRNQYIFKFNGNVDISEIYGQQIIIFISETNIRQQSLENIKFPKLTETSFLKFTAENKNLYFRNEYQKKKFRKQ